MEECLLPESREQENDAKGSYQSWGTTLPARTESTSGVRIATDPPVMASTQCRSFVSWQ